jgi:hypothetical protein
MTDQEDSYQILIYHLSHACSTCVIKIWITIVGQISKFQIKYATGVRHSVIGALAAHRYRRSSMVLAHV